MNSFVKTGIPFHVISTPSSIQIHDSLRLGKKIESFRTVLFGVFQSAGEDGKDYSGAQCGLNVRPLGIFLIDKPEGGGDAFYFWGECVSIHHRVGPPIKDTALTGFVFGQINHTHGRGFLNLSHAPFGLEQVFAVTSVEE